MPATPPWPSERELLLAFVDSRPEPGFPDELVTVADLRRFQANADEVDLTLARQVRDELARILLAPRDVATEVFNSLCELLGVRPKLTHPGAIGWQIERGGNIAPLLTSLVGAVMNLWTTGQLDHVRVCEADTCVVPFVDGSPRHNRRYCSDNCATRTRVQRHRRRVIPNSATD